MKRIGTLNPIPSRISCDFEPNLAPDVIGGPNSSGTRHDRKLERPDTGIGGISGIQTTRGHHEGGIQEEDFGDTGDTLGG